VTRIAPSITRRAFGTSLLAATLLPRRALAAAPPMPDGIVSIRSWIPTELHTTIARATEARDLTPFIQRALDEAPLGGTLYFPPGDYRVFSTLRMTRQVNLWGDAARLVGFFDSNRTDPLLQISLRQAANGSGDARRMRIDGMTAYFATGGGDALLIRSFDKSSTKEIGNLGMVIERCGLSGPPIGNGVALRIEGNQTQAHVIRDCDIANTVCIACTDGVALTGNIISGNKPGIVVDLVEGAFKTEIAHNLIVSRDGAIVVRNGSQVDILNNQIEQPPALNQSPHSAHIVFEPTRYASHDCRVRGNNFGGGTNLLRSIWCGGGNFAVENLTIAENSLNFAGPGPRHVDIELADAAVRWTRIDGNSARGSRPGVDPSWPLAMIDRGTGTYGVRQTPASALVGAGWQAAPDFRFWKTLDDILHFSGALTASGAGSSSTMMTLPSGFRPRTTIRFTIPGHAGPVMLIATADGSIQRTAAYTGSLDFGSVALPVVGRAVYAPGV
jgi:Pectate lyase superfamily protein